MLYSANVRSNELRGGQRIDTGGKLTWKKPVESALKGDQKSFQLCLVTLRFYTTNSLRKKTLKTFSTPFTCTEIIAHVKTLKYFALASKISVGAEDKSQNLLIL